MKALGKTTRVAWLTLALGCGAGQGVAPRGAHPPNDAISVPYPPPPAKVEEVPARPAERCVWVDGYWDFSDRWEWQAGEWIIPPASCRLAPVELRRKSGRLMFARPRWYPENVTLLGPQSACPRPAACGGVQPGRTPGGNPSGAGQ